MLFFFFDLALICSSCLSDSIHCMVSRRCNSMEMSFPLKLQRGHCAPRYLPRPAQKSEDTTCEDAPMQLFCEIPLEQVQQLPTVRRKFSTNAVKHFSEFLTSPGMLCGTACLLPCSNSPAAQVRVHGLQQKIEKSGKLLN